MCKNAVTLARRFGRSVAVKAGAAGTAAMLVAGSAVAALPTDVTTQIDETKADITTMGGLILVLAIVLAGFAWLRRGTK